MSERQKVNFELDPEELGGHTIAELKCRACSGYGNCGYRMYRLVDKKPVLICQLRKQEMLEQDAKQ